MEQDQWHWQEPGTAWKGICVYHITLTVPSREPLLGRLVIPDGDPSQARVERTALGNAANSHHIHIKQDNFFRTKQ